MLKILIMSSETSGPVASAKVLCTSFLASSGLLMNMLISPRMVNEISALYMAEELPVFSEVLLLVLLVSSTVVLVHTELVDVV